MEYAHDKKKRRKKNDWIKVGIISEHVRCHKLLLATDTVKILATANSRTQAQYQ